MHYLHRELLDRSKEQSDFFEFLRKSCTDGLWYWDLENPEHEWMSPEFWQLFGYVPGEKPHLAMSWQDLIFSEDLALAKENLNKHLADPFYPYDQVVRYHHRSGYTVWVRCRGMAYRDPQTGKPTRMLGAHTDMTKSLASEQMIAALQQQVEALRMKLSAMDMRLQTVVWENERLRGF